MGCCLREQILEKRVEQMDINCRILVNKNCIYLNNFIYFQVEKIFTFRLFRIWRLFEELVLCPSLQQNWLG